MREIETARKIALLLKHLKVALGPPPHGQRKRQSKTHSAEELAFALNAALGQSTAYDREDIDAAIRMHSWPSLEDQKRLLAAIDTLCQVRGLQLRTSDDVPEAIEARYAQELPKAFRRRSTEIRFEGDAVGELTHVLSGLWRFFYVSPVDKNGDPKPEIRSFPAIFGKSDETSTSIRLTMLSSSKTWVGTAFTNASHLHLIVHARVDMETASFLTNTPSKRDRIIAGLGLPIRRRSFAMQPVLATLVFGRQWDAMSGLQPTWSSETDRERTIETIRSIGRNADVSTADYDLVRKAFRLTLAGFDDLGSFDSQLYQYLRETTINGKPATDEFQSLFLRWP